MVEPKKRINSRTKGSTYELKISKMFALWFGEEIRRTPLSGGWSKDPAFKVAGDLICSNPRFLFHCELKKREGWSLDDLLSGARTKGTSSIWEWWTQCITECPKGRIPLLVCSKNRFTDLALIREEDFVEYAEDDAETAPCISFFYDKGNILVMPLVTLLTCMKPFPEVERYPSLVE